MIAYILDIVWWPEKQEINFFMTYNPKTRNHSMGWAKFFHAGDPDLIPSPALILSIAYSNRQALSYWEPQNKIKS